MKYYNAKEALPEWLLKQVQVYVQGEVLYIPKKETVRLKWGEANGARKHYMKRNIEIVKKYGNGACISDLSSNTVYLSTALKNFVRYEESHITKKRIYKDI